MDYEQGLQILKQLAQGTEWSKDLMVYEKALSDLLHSRDSTDVISREKQEIIDHLGQICWQHIGVSFLDLCHGKVIADSLSQPGKRSGGVEIGILLTLKEEFNELFREIKGRCQVHQGTMGNYYYLFEQENRHSRRRWQCVATFIGDMGLVRASLATQQFIEDIKPHMLVFLGLAGGLSTAIGLGDVVVADQVDAYLENSKAVDNDFTEAYDFRLSGQVYRGSVDLLRFARNFEFAYPQFYLAWQEQCRAELVTLFTTEQLSEIKKYQLIHETSSIFEGHLASGPIVSASRAFIDRLKARDRSYLALDMESAGLLAAVNEHSDPVRTLILRSISDYGDRRKTSLDSIGEGAFRRYAMRNVIHLLWWFLEADIPFTGNVPARTFPHNQKNQTARPPEGNSQIELVFLYASGDESLLTQLAITLAPFKQNGLIAGWSNQRIGVGIKVPGEAFDESQAQIMVVLLSSNLLASNYQNNPQLVAMIDRHSAHTGLVVPVLFHKVDLQHTMFANFPCLPANRKPMNEWPSPLKALLDIGQGLAQMIADFRASSA